MFKQHAKLVYRGLYLADIAITAASFFAAYWIRASFLTRWELISIYPVKEYTWLILVIIPAWTYLLRKNGAYASHRTIPFPKEMATILKAVVPGGLIIGAAAFVSKSHYLSRALILAFVIINPLLLILERFCIRLLARIVRKRGYNFRNVLIVGINETARDIARRIESYDHWGLRILGFVTTNGDETGCVVDGSPVIGKIQDLERIIQQEVVDEVIVTDIGKKLENFENTVLMLEDHGINTRIVAKLFPHVIAKIHLEELESIPLLSFTTTPQSDTAMMMKRSFDLVAGGGFLVLAAPVMLITAILVKATSPGPVLFTQKRSGLNGRIFTLYKFRSMFVDAEERRKDLGARNEMNGPVFKVKDDPRITPVGRLIRRTSIDELPQLWNVLKGDMSIVGPRPPIPDEVEQYERWQRRRLSMRPGLTCLWQVNGRSNIKDFDDWVKMDLEYIDTWSLALDMKICLKTIPVVLFRKGAA